MKRFMVAPMVLFASLICSVAGGSPLIWQVGRPDDSSAELGGYAAAATAVTLPAARSSVVPKGLHGTDAPRWEIRFRLARVPAHGAELEFKLLNATKVGPQLAVHANHLLAGLIQLWGTDGTTSPYRWRKTYRLYIPPEMLVRGLNTLRLSVPRPLYADASWDAQLWFEWDYVRLTSLATRPTEPIHGAVFHLGTTLTQSAGDFKIDSNTVTAAPVMLKWLGVAFSGNAVRANMWYDVSGQQPARLEYLKTLAGLNMAVVADNVSPSHVAMGPGGEATPPMRAAVKEFFDRYGRYVQWYELSNEPTNFPGPNGRGAVLVSMLGFARLVDELKPAHVKALAPGWAYNPKGGSPDGWEGDPAQRRKVEDLCQALNGHSYGYSYSDNRGGSFVENLASCHGVTDGWPKPYVNTETGANNWHSEENGPRLGSSQPHASAFDRILRAHVVVVDYAMQHAAIFDDFGLFEKPASWSQLDALRAYPGVGAEDPRLKAYRRIALAYATHGAPLGFRVLNASALRDRLVYVRAVDTSTLTPLPGSGARAHKVLVSFVNFEARPATVSVKVSLPSTGLYAGERFGAGSTYAEARTPVRMRRGATATLTETLGPGEAAQYILEKQPGR